MPARDLAPPCQDAAPLIKSSRPSGQYLVVYREGVDARAMTAQLAASYQFTAIYVFVGAPFQGFGAVLTAQTVAKLRCEPAIDHVSEAGLVLLFNAR